MRLFHVSLSAADPELAARFIARLMGGEALPFPPFPDSWIAFGRADDGTAVEVYPLTHRLLPGPGNVLCETGAAQTGPTFAHVALASPLPAADILTMGKAEGWPTRRCNRGPFECIEIWLENRLLVEALDPEMAEDYRAGMTAANWRTMFGMV
ncbi:hypothetical protein P1J78_18095 [Psychromarinibacter sp. C21-152]|uniref:Glyoxalase/Bleomycin resistance protein/Dioxygenase superfamily protein n=1 Tax=Psychromarinibacter sediminicola TaxID=3033385 RepID=A0AAE3NVX2_9RHOB|nr:hypothetical protein [Psychromarinibacter sediminicola]MDF0602654.1 hypothetical protein [Psychromarinibacter sediminicola]